MACLRTVSRSGKTQSIRVVRVWRESPGAVSRSAGGGRNEWSSTGEPYRPPII